MFALQLEEISKKFGGDTAVHQLSIEVHPGEIYGLLGANGAGKTTTMRMALGIIYPDAGQILWKGNKFSKDLVRVMGYLPEERGLYPKVTVKDQLVYLAALRGMDRKSAEQALHNWLERFNVVDYGNKRVEELSKGNQQKIQFIAAVIHKPEILILDEAFSGLDPVNVELLKQVVKELRDQGAAILFSTHRMDHVEELCQSITILKKSNTILHGNLQTIKNAYPKDTLRLITSSDVMGLEAIRGVQRVQVKDHVYQMKLDGMEIAQNVLKHAMEQADILHFEIVGPTLNEIFIQTVGGQHE